MDPQQNHDAVYSQDHKGKFSHEALGGAAAFAAMRAYEKHQGKEGKPPNHQLAKEMLAGLAGGEADKLAETKGLNEMDAMHAKNHARQEAERMYNQNYGGQS
ncbi:hypothetical protein WJX75_003248 [Coccomyxa subellipsoidea]|uniref:CipC-like antibiotic response protein n=1 Tax=Coccomyxa subellipsoidea TaxID=248742 RepID=A0ABR2YTG8_9CHLO